MLGFSTELAPQVITVPAFAETDLTAASTGDNTEVVGVTIDLQSLVSIGVAGFTQVPVFTRAGNAMALVIAKTNNTANKVLNITSTWQYSLDNSNWFDVTVANGCGQNALAVAIGSLAGTGAQNAVYKHGLNIKRLPTGARYIRFKPTPDLTASGTDTATITGCVVFSDIQNTPTSLH